MRKFTYIDTRNWKVVDINGKVITFLNKDGKNEALKGLNGYRSALQAAKKHSGTPVRE